MVKINTPGDTRVEHQNGRTDVNGCFAFVPDTPGQWQIIVNGGMGHMIISDFTVADALTPIPAAAGTAPYSRIHGIVTGISIIFRITGIFAWGKNRRRLS